MTFQKQHECLSLIFMRIFFVRSAGGSKCGNEYTVIQNQFLSHALSAPMKDWQAHQQLPLVNALLLWPEKTCHVLMKSEGSAPSLAIVFLVYGISTYPVQLQFVDICLLVSKLLPYAH